MHGRVKVKTTAEQQAAKEKERAVKLQLYTGGQQMAQEKRNKGEFDNEALTVAGHLLFANPDLYTIWNFRKEILLEFKNKKDAVDTQSTMDAELAFVDNCLRTNPKSYGAWHHRVWVLEQMPNPDWNRELNLCSRYLELDDRNFHCWDYRRFVAKQAAVEPEQELQFTDTKIATNFSNYSSWHYRSKLLPLVFPDAHDGVRPICEEKLLQEFELVQSAAFTDPYDQSAWFYHRWLMGRGDRHVELNCLLVKRTGAIILVFNKPILLDHVSTFVDISVNQAFVSVDWSSITDWSDASHVVLGTILNTDMHEDDKIIEVAVTYKTLPALTVRLGNNQSEESIEIPRRMKNFGMELSAATSSMIQQEIESCVQLQELEPDCKWPLLTTILLMRSLDYAKYSDKILDYFEMLTNVDPLRTGYYKNLRSKFIIEHCLENLKTNIVELSLAGHGLDCLYHLEYLVSLRKLDLSSNRLRDLSRSIAYLVNLESLVVDDNQLSDCDPLENLLKLRELYIRNNNIKEVISLKGLLKCQGLVNLAIDGNPIVEKYSGQHKSEIEIYLPHLKLFEK